MKDARWVRVPAHRRPYYQPPGRMRILPLRAVRGWTTKQSVDSFLVTEGTITSWMKRLDEGEEHGLVQMDEPVNKFPDFVACLVRRLKVTCPALGKVRIAYVLARASLHLGATTVAFLNTAIRRSGAKPKYLITDKGSEFTCQAFRDWCKRKGIRSRYGAVGKQGSIAIVERFIRSLKSEYTRRITVPFGLGPMRHELACYATWYNQHRPLSGIEGRTPMEMYRGLPPANEAPRIEPRPRWPRKSRCAAPVVSIAGRIGARPRLVVSRLEGRAHLPVVELRTAA